MKILKKGGVVKRKPWTGKKITCEVCGAKFKLENKDRVLRNPIEDDPRVSEIGFKVICLNIKCRARCTFLI